MIGLFDEDDAKTARDKALAAVAAHGGDWRLRALEALALLRGFEGTAEDIRIRLRMKGLDPPHHHNAWGEFTKTAITENKIVPTGQMLHMKTKKSHARKTPVYRVL